MTSIFLSHSTKDKEAAQQLKTWLESDGRKHWVFLDDDIQTGIRGGANWEQALYGQLRRCQIYLPLLTRNWASSKWCFAEMVVARSMGKIIVPVKIGRDLDIPETFSDIQQIEIDLTDSNGESYERLERALNEVFPWDDPDRPPYPGLTAFQEDEAAIFFGREPEIARDVEVLERLRRQGRAAPAFVLVLGASGSGKSSIVRAGLIPRLRHSRDWLPVSPFRPQSHPIDGLAETLSKAFEREAHPRSYHDLKDALDEAAGREQPDGDALLNIVRDLRIEAQSGEDAVVLLVIDQAEELFLTGDKVAADRFLRFLRAALEKGGGRVMALATMRSEFLSEFQTHSFLLDKDYEGAFAYEKLTVDPLPQDRFAAIIRGPAELAGLVVEDDLVNRMVNDTGTRDALPLLAFTLRRMWDNASYRDGRFDLSEYEKLGGLEGAIRRAADDALIPLEEMPDQLDALRAAFVPTMVRVGPDGARVRRRAYRKELPREAERPIQSFINARLLVTDRDPEGHETIEVAHEALLRVWPRLSGWLREDQDRLRLFQGIRTAASDWERGDKRPDLLVHRGERLTEALELVAEPRFAFKPGSAPAEYLVLCEQEQREREQAERAEQERRLQDAERLAEARSKTIHRARQGLVAVLLVALVAIAAAWIARDQMAEAQRHRLEAEHASQLAEQQRLEAEAERARAREAQKQAQREAAIARARWIAAQANAMADTSPQRALLLAVEALKGPLELDGTRLAGVETVLRDLLGRIGGLPLPGHERPIDRVLVDPKGRWIASRGGRDGKLRLWSLNEPRTPAITLPVHNKWFHSLAFDPQGRWLVTGSLFGAISLWDLDDLARYSETGELKKVWRLAGRTGKVDYLAFDAEGRWLAVRGRSDADLQVWDLDDLEKAPLVLVKPEGGYNSGGLAMDPKGRWLALGYSDGTWLWDLNHPEARPRLLSYDRRQGDRLALDPKGRWLAAADSSSGRVQFWDLTDPKKSPVVSPRLGDSAGGDILSLRFDSQGRWLVVATGHPATGGGRKGKVYLFNLEDPVADPVTLPVRAIGEAAPVFDPQGRWLAVAHGDDMVRLWDPADLSAPALVLRGHEDKILDLAFAPDGKRLVTGGRERVLRVWTLPYPTVSPVIIPCGPPGQTPAIAFDPRSGHLVTTFFKASPIHFRDPENLFVPTVLPCTPSKGVSCRTMGWPTFDPTGRWLARVWRGQAWLYDLDVPDAAPNMLLARGRSMELAFGPKGRWLAVSGWEEREARLWDLSGDWGEPRVLQAAEREKRSGIWKLAFDKEGSRLATSHWDETIRLWDLANPAAAPIQLPGRPSDVVAHWGSYTIWQLAFGPDGRWLAAASEDAARLYDLSDLHPKPLFLREKKETIGDGMQIAFDPEGRWLAASRRNGNLRLWSLADLTTKPLLLRAEDRPVWTPVFDRSGRWLATSGGEGRRTAHLWSTDDLAASPLILRGHEGELSQLAFDPQGRWLATAARDGTVRLWPLSVDELVTLACRTAGRNLDSEEWQRYLGDRELRKTCPEAD